MLDLSRLISLAENNPRRKGLDHTYLTQNVLTHNNSTVLQCLQTILQVFTAIPQQKSPCFNKAVQQASLYTRLVVSLFNDRMSSLYSIRDDKNKLLCAACLYRDIISCQTTVFELIRLWPSNIIHIHHAQYMQNVVDSVIPKLLERIDRYITFIISNSLKQALSKRFTKLPREFLELSSLYSLPCFYLYGKLLTV